MSTNQYTWKIEQLDCTPSANGLVNVVKVVHWRINATDGNNHNVTIYGTQGLEPPDSNNFIQYSSLTANQVITWVQDAMGSNTVSELYSGLDSDIQNIITPQNVSPALPWSANT
jgi:regulator of protease activity HflC (stomatin/prohibitin superfamily)